MGRGEYLEHKGKELAARMTYLADASPFYRRLLKRVRKDLEGVTPEGLPALLDRVPYTIKEDLRRGFPRAFLATEWTSIRAYFESSGTSDGSIRSSRSMALRTTRDLERDIERRLPAFLGDGAGQVAVVNLPFAVTSSALGFYTALAKAGFITVAADQGQLLCSHTRTADLAQGLDASVLVTADPLLLRDVVLYDTGVDFLQKSRLKWILCVGVPLSRGRREWIRQQYGIAVLPYYGLSEFGAVGVPDRQGRMYVHDDFFIEIHNPRNPDSPAGEIVIWDLVGEGSPLIRYQTGDVGRVEFEADEMGKPRTYLEVLGRRSEVIFDGERYLLPTAFQDLVTGFTGISPVHRVTIDGEESLQLTLDVQLCSAAGEAELDALRRRADALTSIPITVRPHKFGDLFPAVYGQEMYKGAQTAKSMAFHDRRRGQWIVTY